MAVRGDGDLASPRSLRLRNDDRNDAPIERRLNAIGVDGLGEADDSLELTERTLRDVDLVLITVFRSGPRSPDGQRALVEREVDRIVRDSGDVERHQERIRPLHDIHRGHPGARVAKAARERAVELAVQGQYAIERWNESANGHHTWLLLRVRSAFARREFMCAHGEPVPAVTVPLEGSRRAGRSGHPGNAAHPRGHRSGSGPATVAMPRRWPPGSVGDHEWRRSPPPDRGRAWRTQRPSSCARRSVGRVVWR